MKISYKVVTLFMVMAIAAVACGGSASTAPSSEPSTAASGEPSQAAGLEGNLTIWHAYGSSGGAAEFNAFQKALKAVTDANPGLVVSVVQQDFGSLYTNFENESGAGGGPDMFIGPNDSLGNEARGGYLVDLTGKIDDVLAASSEVSVAGSKVGDAVYMVPESLKAVAMYYDSAVVTTAPTTTEELLQYVKDGGKVGLITGAYFGWGFYSAFGGAIFDADGKCAAADGGVADAIAYVKELRDAGALVDPDYGKVNDAFLNKDIDIMLNGNWVLGDYKTARPALAVGPVPAGPGGAAKTMTGVDGWYINAASTNQDLAIAVASALVSAASQQVMVDDAGHVPANTSVNASDELVAAFTAAISAGDARPQGPEMGNYWGPFGDAWNKAIPADGSAGSDPATEVATACGLMDDANNK
ncbi:MAG TPA: extracellular solute-binding protein [Candidatus Polarisedimenticolia bacterium]|nr:extracellular solute-binding protein [Candidatus Polarisedimenticolia bacterium]